MVELKSVEIFSRDNDHADVTIPVSGEWTLEEFKEKMESKKKNEAYFIYFHQGVEIEFDDDTLLSEVFGPDFTNDQGVAQVDVFLPSAAQVSIKLDSLALENCEILDEYGEIVTLEPGPENSESVYLKPIGRWFSSIFTEFPVKLRVVIDKPRANTILVRQYQIETVDTIVEIKANGDIWCDDEKALAAKKGTVMEFNSKKYSDQIYKETKEPHFLPGTFHFSSTVTKFWANQKVVQNALLCCQAAYQEGTESYIANTKRFSSLKYECIFLIDIPQKCVLVFCNESSTMYITFRGSVDLDDWLVNLNIQSNDFTLISPVTSESQNCSPKVHTGFHGRAKKWIIEDEQIMKKIKEWKPKRIVTTGHSLGAATSSIAHILLVLSQDKEIKEMELQNIAFATPLFGNLDLKKAILKHPDPRLKNMHHFVNCDDVVPAVSIIEETYANLNYSVGALANNSNPLLKLFYALGYIDMGETQEAELLAKLENVLLEVKKRKKLINQPLLQDRGNDTYMPIGHFIFMKKKASGQSDPKSDLHVFDFEESEFIEDSEHQWIGQILIKSLKNLRKVKIRLGVKYDHILLAHGLKENYFAQVSYCLTSGVHDNLMQWKLETDREIN